jgi:hypothetical protein
MMDTQDMEYYPTADRAEWLHSQAYGPGKYTCLLAEVLDYNASDADETIGDVECSGHFMQFSFTTLRGGLICCAWAIVHTDNQGFVSVDHFTRNPAERDREWALVVDTCDSYHEDVANEERRY